MTWAWVRPDDPHDVAGPLGVLGAQLGLVLAAGERPSTVGAAAARAGRGREVDGEVRRRGPRRRSSSSSSTSSVIHSGSCGVPSATAEMTENSDSCSSSGDLGARQLVELGPSAKLVVVGVLAAQAVAALLGDLGGVGAQAGVVGDEEEGLLVAHAPGPAHEAADGLAEEQLGRGGGGEHADPQAGDVDALGHHAHRHDPRLGARGEVLDARRRGGVVAQRPGWRCTP